VDKDVRINGRRMFVMTTGLDERLLNDKRLKSTRISTKTPCNLRKPQIPGTKSPHKSAVPFDFKAPGRLVPLAAF
jgi:hypothetical protein